MLSASIKGIASHTTIDITTNAALHLEKGLSVSQINGKALSGEKQTRK